MVGEDSIQEKAEQIGQRRGSPPPHVRVETTHDMVNSLTKDADEVIKSSLRVKLLLQELRICPSVTGSLAVFQWHDTQGRTDERLDSVYNFKIF